MSRQTPRELTSGRGGADRAFGWNEVDAFVLEARRHRHRSMLVLAGACSWARAAGCRVLDRYRVTQHSALWISDRASFSFRCVRARDAPLLLGQEFAAVVFDAYSGFDPDAFGAVTGTVIGGGLVLLLCPPLDGWPGFDDPERDRMVVFPYREAAVGGRFVTRMVRHLRGSDGVRVLEEQACGTAFANDPALEFSQPSRSGASVLEPGGPRAVSDSIGGAGGGCRTCDQGHAVDAIIHVMTGQRRRPVILLAPRGRGKSAALGIAAARLLGRSSHRIVVTAPSLEAAKAVFLHANRLLPEAQVSDSALHYGDGGLYYCAPDRLLRDPRTFDLVLVDEAAGIPLPLLEGLVKRFPRSAFASTTHGYEGTGRGFEFRFTRLLDRHTRGWRRHVLETPVRWGAGDPVERFVSRLLLLDGPSSPSVSELDGPRECTFQRMDRDMLVANERALSDLFGILVLSHYRTRPHDLRQLMDGPNIHVHAIRCAERIIGTAIVAVEGGFDIDMATAVWAGARRPRGHLLPETLAAQLGLRDAPRLNGIRVMRLAIHPAVQGRGLGSALIRHVESSYGDRNVDYLGSSFGATPDLIRFWSRAGFLPVRMSIRRGATSGAHSVVMLRPLNRAGAALTEGARKRFRRSFPGLLGESLRDLEPEIVNLLLRGLLPANGPALDGQDWLDVVAFAFGRRVYESAADAVWRLAWVGLQSDGGAVELSDTERAGLVMRVLQRRSWTDVAGALDLPGRAAVSALLRSALRKLVRRLGDVSVNRLADQLAGAK